MMKMLMFKLMLGGIIEDVGYYMFPIGARSVNIQVFMYTLESSGFPFHYQN